MALSIQRLALPLNQVPPLLDYPTLSFLLIKSFSRPADCCRLNKFKTNEIFDNVMYSTLESALCTYVAKQHYKSLRWEFGTQEMGKRLLAEEYSRLKSRVDELEGTMKDTLDLVDKL